MPDRETFHVLFDKTDGTIAEYVVRKKLSLKQRLELALKVGYGLQLLHLIQYVHLDLRPSNILVSQEYLSLIPTLLCLSLAFPKFDQTGFDIWPEFLL
jgi:tRNA A-37 threonylcarbamoyl transferase component Bud32